MTPSRNYQGRPDPRYGTQPPVEVESGDVSCRCRQWIYFSFLVAVVTFFLAVVGVSTSYWGFHQSDTVSEASERPHSGLWRYCFMNDSCVSIDTVTPLVDAESLPVVRAFDLLGFFALLVAIIFMMTSLCGYPDGRTTIMMIAVILYFLSGLCTVIAVCAYAMRFRYRHDLGFSYVLATMSAFGAVIAGGFSGLDYVNGKNGL